MQLVLQSLALSSMSVLPSFLPCPSQCALFSKSLHPILTGGVLGVPSTPPHLTSIQSLGLTIPSSDRFRKKVAKPLIHTHIQLTQSGTHYKANLHNTLLQRLPNGKLVASRCNSFHSINSKQNRMEVLSNTRKNIGSPQSTKQRSQIPSWKAHISSLP